MSTYLQPSMVKTLRIADEYSDKQIGEVIAALILLGAYRMGLTPREFSLAIAEKVEVTAPDEAWDDRVLNELRYVLSGEAQDG